SFLVYRMAGVGADAADSLHSVALGALALALIANFGSVALKTAVWKRAVEALPGSPRPGYRGLLPAVFIGFLGNTVLAARLGEVARVAVVSRRLRASGSPVPAAALAGTLVAEQLALGAALLILGAGLTVTVVDLPGWALTSMIALAAVVISAVLVAVLSSRIGGRVPFSAPRRLRRLAGPAAEALRASGHLSRDPRAMSAAIALGIASWALQILGIYWTLQAFGLPHTAASASAVFLVSTLVGLFPLLPGNVGVFQVAVAGILAASFGVDAASGAAFGIGLQAVEVVLGAGLGAVFLIAEGLSLSDLRRSADPEPVTQIGAPEFALAQAA
ncbi:MAG TPA: lysylphosphatidylglycerol synthase transmembrane domain-containing protein, partial [Gaiellales bacterium]|nr:lysylphosphatidylglycerol synthase transmembrane domain-containing protein [Gaiellales bacterium]